VDGEAAERAFDHLSADPAVAAAWPALAPVVAASPYLAGLMLKAPQRLSRLLAADPDAALAALAAEAAALPPDAALPASLRALKAELHLLCALCDLGGVWTLEAVTGALSTFADAAVRAALRGAAAGERAAGRLLGEEDAADPAPGLFVLALGKHGAGELNYSSDIDISIFYEPARLPLAPGVEPQRTAQRLTQALARTLGDITPDGYVFRVDLRLRPDPSSTPVAVPVEQALDYYGTVGQNWERAAMIKARVCAGDVAAGRAFLDALQPFVWRRALDYAAIEDIHAIKRQIHVHKGFDDPEGPLATPGADLKLGAGGIREIEFYAQTQQLILGGRDTSLRSPRTLDALAALTAAGHVTPEACADLTAAYRRLRAWEHRVQMLHDAQTHRAPVDVGERRAVAALSGFPSLPDFDAAVAAVRASVNARYGALFAADESLSSEAGSLVFTGVDDDPETLATLARLGFSRPADVSAAIRAWHHGRIAATRTARGRELFTRLAPRLLDACAATGAPDFAFTRFADFFSGLRSGVQVQSLFLAQPPLFALVIRILALSPRLAAVLAKRPAALDALLDGDFFEPLEPQAIARAVAAEAARAPQGFEAAMDAVRRAYAEQAFRIGVHLIDGRAEAVAAHAAFTALADACLDALAPAALAEVERVGGTFAGEVAVLAMGAFGGQEMTARSDLDLMTVYRAAPDVVSAGKGWAAETVYGRFTQRLVAALSAPTAEGGLYAVDLQLRPSGTAGPVAVSLTGLEAYYAGEAQGWEFLALTRARVAWATSPAFAQDVRAAVERALRRPRDVAVLAAEVRDMRALMERERPPSGPYDLKLSPGGLVDVEFTAQHLQLAGAAQGGPLDPNTLRALTALQAAGRLDPAHFDDLTAAWRLSRRLQQVLRLALESDSDPSGEPAGLKALLARAAGVERFEAVLPALTAARTRARAAFLSLVA
jgi:glutamate-ammonia-ligase adenylyltransferase